MDRNRKCPRKKIKVSKSLNSLLYNLNIVLPEHTMSYNNSKLHKNRLNIIKNGKIGYIV